MADIKLRIEVNPNAETETLGDITNKTNDTGTNSNLSNTSFKANYNGVFENLPDKRVNGSNGLSMASDDNSDAYDFIFNELDELDNIDKNQAIIEDEEAPSEFIWGIVPNNKQYSVKLTFTNATALKDIIIYGDTEVGQFPTKAIIDEKRTIYSDDASWAINMETESDTHTIEFLEWNRVNYNACISNIRVTLRYLDLDKSWIDEVNSLTQSTSDSSTIQYGVLANSGSTKIRDLNGELKDYVQDNVIPNADVPIEVYINDNKIQSHISDDTNYDSDDKILNIQLTNFIENIESIIIPEIKMTENINAYQLLNEILTSVGLQSYLSEMAQNDIEIYLKNINLGYIHLESNNLIYILNYFCELIQCNLLLDDNGILRFVNGRPIESNTKNNNWIKIPKSFMINNLKDTLILKNKIKSISFDEIQYNRKDRYLPALESQSGEIDKLNEYIKEASIWYSDYFNDEKSILDNDSYTQEKYIDSSGNEWNICYRKEKLQNYTRCLTNTNILDLKSMSPLIRTGNTFYNDNRSPIYAGTKNLQEFKTTLNSIASNSNFRCTFLERAFSPIKYIDHIDSNLFVKEVQPIFAYKTAEGVITFPVQFFIVSSVNQSGSKIITCKEDILIESNNSITYYSTSTAFGNLDISFNSNPLISNTTKYNGQKISKVISDNILSDYKNGISNATIDIFCGDMYNANGDKIKDWSQGQIIAIGDIVYFEDDKYSDQSQRYWKVTGRNFKYSGAPTISLELQEVIIMA